MFALIPKEFARKSIAVMRTMRYNMQENAGQHVMLCAVIRSKPSAYRGMQFAVRNGRIRRLHAYNHG